MNINTLLETKDYYLLQLNKYYKNSKYINKIKKEIYKINILLAPKNKFLSLLNDYYENVDLDEEKRKKIMNKIRKKISTLVNYVKKKPFFISKNKIEKELIFLIKYINYYTQAYRDSNIEHYDFRFVKNEKIIHNIFLKYIIEEKDIYEKTIVPAFTEKGKDFTYILIFNIIRYTALNDFNINNIYDNITSYTDNLITLNTLNINLNNKYIPPYDIIIEDIPVKKIKTFKLEIGNKFFDSNYNTLYIYEDKNYNEHLTNEKGVEYDYIRKYNFMGKGRIPLGAGIITLDDNSIKLSIAEIKELISKYKYKKIKFLSDVNANYETLFFSTNESLSDMDKKYIVYKIYNLKKLLFEDDRNRIFNNAKTPRKKNPITPKNEKIIPNNHTYLPQKLEEKIDHNPKYDSTKLPSKTVKISQDIEKKSPKINYLPIPIIKNPSFTSPQPTTRPTNSSTTRPKPTRPAPQPTTRPKPTRPTTRPTNSSPTRPKPTRPAPQPTTRPTTRPTNSSPTRPKPTRPAPQPTTRPTNSSPTRPGPPPNPSTQSSTQPSTQSSTQPTSSPKKSPKQKVIKMEIIPSVFTGNNKIGDFKWEIEKTERWHNTLYIFNDNFEHHKSDFPDGNNGVIRKYNKYSNYTPPRSAGISTGWGGSHIDPVNITINGNKVTKYGAFKEEDKHYWKQIVDSEITEIIEELLKTGYYKRIVFSAQGDKNNKPLMKNGIPVLGTQIFRDLDKEITTYIPYQIYTRLQTIKIDPKIDPKMHQFLKILTSNPILYYKGNNLIINEYIFYPIIPDYSYYRGKICVNILKINNNTDKEIYNYKRNSRHLDILNQLNNNKNISIPELYKIVDIPNRLLVFSQYFDTSLFKYLNYLKKNTINIYDIHIIKNMMQQLLMAIISYHTNTGLINTNINAKNIYSNYNKETKEMYICYKLYEDKYYIKHNGYIWYLTDFSESIELPKNKEIIFNEKYDSYHIYCEFKVIVETIKFELYNKKNTVLNNFIENILLLINNYKTSMKETFDKFKNTDNILKYMDTMLFNQLMFDLDYDTDSSNKIIYDKVYKIL